MNDAERDAWLREALRHAPDAEALPPTEVSASILAQARAAAKATAVDAQRPRDQASGRRRAAPRSVWAALWDSLAPPPVAAGFASVMAATLVGVMWWGRPMDEGMPRAPASASERAETKARAEEKAAAPTVTPAAPAESARTEPAVSLSERALDAPTAERQASRRQAATPVAPTAPTAPVAPVVPKPEAIEDRLTGRADAAKKDAAADASAAPLARQRVDADTSSGPGAANTTAAPPAAAPAQVTAAAPARAPEAGKLAAGAAPADTSRDAPKPFADTAAAAPPPARAVGDLRAKETTAIAASPAPALSRAEADRSRNEAAVGAPLAGVLAAIAADPERWSRQSAGGDTYTLEPGWRAWLGELDAAAGGRWQPRPATGDRSDTESSGRRATVLRLVSGGRVAAVVRLDGTAVEVETASGSARRWQATLNTADAERLRREGRRLPP